MIAPFKILDERIRPYIPRYATPGSAAMDLCALIDAPFKLICGQTAKIKTGISFDFSFNSNVAAMILPRSGLGSKHGIILSNSTGLIDSDYTGEIIVSLWNRSESGFYEIQPFERVAQIVFLPVIKVELEEVKEFRSDTLRGAGGFGSTGRS
jgi:dUTP pyrophosphatase